MRLQFSRFTPLILLAGTPAWSAPAPIAKCDFASARPAIEEAVRAAVADVFKTEGQAFDPATVQFSTGPSISECMGETWENNDPDDPNIVTDVVCSGVDKLPNLKVAFASPSGTALTLYNVTDYTNDKKSGLVFDFTETQNQDRDGNILAPTCEVKAGYTYREPYSEYLMGTLQIFNVGNGLAAPLSSDLSSDALSLALPMTAKKK